MNALTTHAKTEQLVMICWLITTARVPWDMQEKIAQLVSSSVLCTESIAFLL